MTLCNLISTIPWILLQILFSSNYYQIVIRSIPLKRIMLVVDIRMSKNAIYRFKCNFPKNINFLGKKAFRLKLNGFFWFDYELGLKYFLFLFYVIKVGVWDVIEKARKKTFSINNKMHFSFNDTCKSSMHRWNMHVLYQYWRISNDLNVVSFIDGKDYDRFSKWNYFHAFCG